MGHTDDEADENPAASRAMLTRDDRSLSDLDSG